MRYYKSCPPSEEHIKTILRLRLHRRDEFSKKPEYAEFLFRKHLDSRNYDYKIKNLVVAKDAGQIVGWAMLVRRYKYKWWEIQTFVHHSYRRRGIGSRCVKMAMEGHERAYFAVDAAKEFWEYLGLKGP